jgi:hypothetical protein
MSGTSMINTIVNSMYIEGENVSSKNTSCISAVY